MKIKIIQVFYYKDGVLQMKIIIVNEYALVRKAISSFLNQEEDIEVLYETSKITDAIEKIESIRPDIVVFSSRINNKCSADLITECRKRKLITKYMILSSGINEQDFKLFLKYRVEGYLLMRAMPEELLYALRILHKGKRYYDSLVMDLMFNEDSTCNSELTPRELDVLMALGKGMNNKLISENLYISEFTVKKHIGHILSKLNLRDRTEAALFANSMGISEAN